jgi:flagellar biogenesis protein FliO
MAGEIPDYIITVIVALSSAIATLFGALLWAVKRLHRAHEDEVEYLRKSLTYVHEQYVKEKDKNGSE